MYRLLVLVAALIAYGSLYPWEFHTLQTGVNPIVLMLRSWPARVDRYVFRDTVVNLAVYVPFGVAAFLAFNRQWKRWLSIVGTVIAGAALSTSIEVIQLFDDSRSSSIYDVFCNTIGTAIGLFLGIVFKNILEYVAMQARPIVSKRRPGALLLLYCWTAAQIFPLFPSMSPSVLRVKVAHFLSVGSFSAVEATVTLAEWSVVLFLLRVTFGPKLASRLSLLLLLLVPFRLLIIHRVPSFAEFCGAAAAVAVFKWFSFPGSPGVLVALLLSAITIRGLAPFHWASVAAGFCWIPFASVVNTPWEAGLLILARKAFWYGSAVWLLHDDGRKYVSAAAVIAALLACIELVQTHIPGHVPDITDPLLAGLMAWILWLMDRFSVRNRTATISGQAKKGS